MSSPYDLAIDAINTVLSGLLPALIFGMFSGFEWFQYDKDKLNRHKFLLNLIFIATLGIISYLFINSINSTNIFKVEVLKVLKWLHMISLTVYPAIISGYLFSDNPRTTKIAFGITSISFTRLVNHFGDKPEEINTAVSTYLNSEILTENSESIEKLTEEVEKLTNNKETEEPKNEIEAEEEQRIEISEQTDLTEKILRNLKKEIIEIKILKDKITGQLENMKKLKEEKIIKERQSN
ncbi:hypothetical protein RhiirA5_417741 [Rhizophagus irregularis]|uniref:Uncharacterized protein n=1 Tax=Rhizophagus irregularis TaxID=588596 RepID=A0A2I1F8L3_9GLOM|nr:hypothetical protein RhiirA5_427173 [Rhizophagus irregularis]PKC07794.1 hypothetical protein RhiirA5_417741 [Rhizophagus irregularis]PKC74969.1 hypothetical protein RhiirA1_449381 [Rhizophagus irregularis]PKY30719.1 hypothetical protein RhiirB3_447948 [Rhizophagus irregularis]